MIYYMRSMSIHFHYDMNISWTFWILTFLPVPLFILHNEIMVINTWILIRKWVFLIDTFDRQCTTKTSLQSASTTRFKWCERLEKSPLPFSCYLLPRLFVPVFLESRDLWPQVSSLSIPGPKFVYPNRANFSLSSPINASISLFFCHYAAFILL